jgi:cobalamin biosynthesis Mg chelatase CobN
LLAVCRGDLGSSKQNTSTNTTQQQVTVQGGAEGSGTVATGADSNSTVNITSTDPGVVASAFTFGQEIEDQTAQTTGTEDATIQSISGELAQLTANATPQTAAAQSEIESGGSPTSPVSIPNNVVVIATAAVVGIAAIFYFVTRKNA